MSSWILQEKQSLTGSRHFEWGKISEAGECTLRMNIVNLHRAIRRKDADKAADYAKRAAHVVHGCWRYSVAVGGFDKNGRFDGLKTGS